jgi:hypothetical protein
MSKSLASAGSDIVSRSHECELGLYIIPYIRVASVLLFKLSPQYPIELGCMTFHQEETEFPSLKHSGQKVLR